MFNNERLKIARQRRKLTKKQLASLVDLQPRTITAIENGENEPLTDTVEKLSNALDFPVDFFSGETLEELPLESVSFRSLSKLTAQDRHAALGSGSIAFSLSDWIEERFTLPDPDLLDFRNETPETAAVSLRSYWGIGDIPVTNMIHLLEAKGVRVFSLAENCEAVDAFSLWRKNKPYIFLNTLKSSEHSRFDAAHELGHLVLHHHDEPTGKNAEKEANEFASAFLMPENSILSFANYTLSVRNIIALKKRNIVSAVALAYRLHKTGLISDWHYRNICIEMSQLGYRKNEPEPAKRESSKVLQQVFSKLRAEGITQYNIAEELKIPVTEIERPVFRLVLMGVSNETEPLSKNKKRKSFLRLVE